RATAYWTSRAIRGGIWSQAGSVSDGKSLFVTTGNTLWPDTWQDGEAVIRLAPGLAHSLKDQDYYTPSNWMDLDKADRDLGGTAAVLFTVPSQPKAVARLLALGKDGFAYLLDPANLGGVGSQLAMLQVGSGRIVTAPAVYKIASGTL